jgi:putative addiction module CopG family antidote
MSQTFNINLSPRLADFVRERVESGAYASSSEVVREALRWFAARTDGAEIPTLLDVQEQEIDRKVVRSAIKRLRALRKGTKLGRGATLKSLRDDGRR